MRYNWNEEEINEKMPEAMEMLVDFVRSHEETHPQSLMVLARAFSSLMVITVGKEERDVAMAAVMAEFCRCFVSFTELEEAGEEPKYDA